MLIVFIQNWGLVPGKMRLILTSIKELMGLRGGLENNLEIPH
jgi:hypothetical protein